MSGYYVKRPASIAEPSRSEAFQFLSDSWPSVAWFLAGRPADHADGPECAGTVMFFFDSGTLKFCLSPKVGREVAFGTIDDPTKPFDSLEASLIEGKYEWKKRR